MFLPDMQINVFARFFRPYLWIKLLLYLNYFTINLALRQDKTQFTRVKEGGQKSRLKEGEE